MSIEYRALIGLEPRTETTINGHKVVRTPTGQWYIRRGDVGSEFKVTSDLGEALELVQPCKGPTCNTCRMRRHITGEFR